MPATIIQYGDGTQEVIADPRPLQEQIKDVTSQVNQRRDQLIDSGFNYTIRGTIYRFQSESSDRENIMGLAMAAAPAISAGAPPGYFKWIDNTNDFGFITADNQVVLMDPYEMQGLYAAGLAFKMQLTLYARALKDILEATTTPEDLDAINIVDGWPQ